MNTSQVDVEQVAAGMTAEPAAPTDAPVVQKRKRKPPKRVQAMLLEERSRGFDEGLNADKPGSGVLIWLGVALVVGFLLGRHLHF